MSATAISTAEKRNEHLPGPTRRLLLVDDDEPLRNVLNEVVQEWSFATSTAATLQQARDVVLTEEPFTVIVSDYELPDGNGLGFLNWLRREMRIPVPFLLISGGVVRVPAAADDYEFLAKPFRMEELRSSLEKLSCPQLQPAAPYRLTPAQEAVASVYARSKPPKDK
jgi:DNA-binding NtrC family response regulator